MELIAKAEKINLAIVYRKTRALLTIDCELNYRVVDCSRKHFCRVYVSKECPPYCPVIVAAKDFVTARRKPKAEVIALD